MRTTVCLLLLFIGTFGSQAQKCTIRYFDIATNLEIFDFVKDSHIFRFVQKSPGDTVKIWTEDKTFETPEGYKIGTKLGEVNPVLRKQMVKVEREGWLLRLPSGWILIFCDGMNCEDGLLDNSIVKRIRRRM